MPRGLCSAHEPAQAVTHCVFGEGGAAVSFEQRLLDACFAAREFQTNGRSRFSSNGQSAAGRQVEQRRPDERVFHLRQVAGGESGDFVGQKFWPVTRKLGRWVIELLAQSFRVNLIIFPGIRKFDFNGGRFLRRVVRLQCRQTKHDHQAEVDNETDEPRRSHRSEIAEQVDWLIILWQGEPLDACSNPTVHALTTRG